MNIPGCAGSGLGLSTTQSITARTCVLGVISQDTKISRKVLGGFYGGQRAQWIKRQRKMA